MTEFDFSEVYLGTDPVDKIYVGPRQIYPSLSVIPQEVIISAEGGEVVVKVQSHDYWTVF